MVAFEALLHFYFMGNIILFLLHFYFMGNIILYAISCLL